MTLQPFLRRILFEALPQDSLLELGRRGEAELSYFEKSDLRRFFVSLPALCD